MALFIWVVFVSFATFERCFGIFIGEEKMEGSPLRIAQCRAVCLEKFIKSVANSGPTCLQQPDCFMCWENCELLQSNFQVWGGMCEDKSLCFPGCQVACRFHQNSPPIIEHQSSPVIRTSGYGTITISEDNMARWPLPTPRRFNTPLVYVAVARQGRSGPWRQLAQTQEREIRVPKGDDITLRVLAVSKDGLITVYGTPIKEKRGKRVNTEIKSTKTDKQMDDGRWALKEVSLIHQSILVIGEIAWEPRGEGGVYLVTWELDGGGLKGTLYTDHTSVTLSLWPDTIYHIQVELVSTIAGESNFKSDMMDLDTRKAQKISTGAQSESLLKQPIEEVTIDLHQIQLLIAAGIAAVFLVTLCLIFGVAVCKWQRKLRRRRGEENRITGATNIKSKKLQEDAVDIIGCSAEFQPVMVADSPAVTQAFHSSQNLHFVNETTMQQV